MEEEVSNLNKTVLFDWHRSKGAKIVPFAGYHMPVYYGNGILKEHLHTRRKVSLFDISHMGQIELKGPNVYSDFEALVPADVFDLAENHCRYTQFTNDRGGIIDDFIVTKQSDSLNLVVNAACKMKDFTHLKAHLEGSIEIEKLDNYALLALQGPQSAEVLSKFCPEIKNLAFMTKQNALIKGINANISRSGYTGEDGFEISVKNSDCLDLVDILTSEPDVEPAGLGARDTLRLEAGLCLYGNDLDESITPVEANLTWTIGKQKRLEGGFLGDDKILSQLRDGPKKKRIGICLSGKVPARSGADILDGEGSSIGTISSGGYSPTLKKPIAMGYVTLNSAKLNEKIQIIVRKKRLEATIIKTPFVEPNYYRTSKKK